VHSSAGYLYAFDVSRRERDACAPLWVGLTQKQREDRGPQRPALAYGKVYVGANGTFYAFDMEGGEAPERPPAWTATTKCSFFGHPPSVANGVVYSTCGNSYLYAFDAFTGNVLWRYYTPGRGYPMRSTPTIVDGRLYHAATFDFKLYVFHVPGVTTRSDGPP